ncbi:MAG: EF-P beta-lysylation protein EpmB [Pseudomonadales bacterium]|nr:EF-P beta-lysylation protein EpmB [Pseudomonadales bacterium]
MKHQNTLNIVDRTEHSWQQQLSGARRSFAELCTFLDLAEDSFDGVMKLEKQFPIIAPDPYLSRIVKGDPRDPLLLQVLPQAAELISTPGYSDDPLEEANASPVQGLIHKYHGRVLLVASAACAIHCRYCFRRHFPYQENRLQRNQHQQALDYMASNSDVQEVILSGGDPLTLSNSYLSWLIQAITELPQIHTLRIHTRLPIVIPDRVDEGLLELLPSRLKIVMVVHCNHANELDENVKATMEQLTSAGVTLLNQSVLLKGVNDDAAVLAQLSQRLFECGILPYYLHLLDPVQGAAHFDASEKKAGNLMAAVIKVLPGYLVPRLVRERPGAASKTPLPVVT